ncbi:hypothetical protein V5O48_012866 [Marasmius crinis-equi]|uniref:MYND-type domain-containing protein n=1 Tax=Marasmius crinis-equi TaxID=585013 RepID=A0ABR3F1N9_9AGAR
MPPKAPNTRPKVTETITFVHPVTGRKINVHLMDPAGENKPLKDQCNRCRATKTSQKPLKACKPCLDIGRRVLYCSRECQTVDYRTGTDHSSPHKQICGKEYVDLKDDDELDSEPNDDTNIDPSLLPTHLYTTKPSAALHTQYQYLKGPDSQTSHYGLVLSNGKIIPARIQGLGGTIFLQMRKKAFEDRDLASIALMERILSLSLPPNQKYKSGDCVYQLEKEFEVDMYECQARYRESTMHTELWKQWLDWLGPRVEGAPGRPRDGKHVFLCLPPHYYSGDFTHPRDCERTTSR